jgi:hypothetical protein
MVLRVSAKYQSVCRDLRDHRWINLGKATGNNHFGFRILFRESFYQAARFSGCGIRYAASIYKDKVRRLAIVIYFKTTLFQKG